MFSRRTAWDLQANRLARRLEDLRASGRPLVDLTETNPTRAGLTWDAEELASLLSGPALPVYDPAPSGLEAGRRAVSGYLAVRGAEVASDRVLLTASTSEAYSMLFKLLCDPGDEVLVPSPSYPLLDLLADAESVRLHRYPLLYDGQWHIDRHTLAAAVTGATRALVVVSPSNPTGALVSPQELSFLQELCSRNGLALIGDEVFADTARGDTGCVAAESSCLAFHLSGLAKVCGLPQLKVAWMAAAGPAELVDPALARLETIADLYLSVSSPAQRALAPLLARRESFLGKLRERLTANRALLELASLREAPWSLLRSGGGWSAVVQVGQSYEEEALCLALLDDGVVVQPGFFYDFPGNGYLVLSLLPETAVFREGLERLERRLRLPFRG
jgi:alanine-synthesizing transaminase